MQVLGGVVDGALPHNEATNALLTDTLAILCCKQIKLHSLRSKPDEDEAVEEQDMAQAVVAAAQNKLLTKVRCFLC